MSTKIKEKKHTNNTVVDNTEEMKVELESVTKPTGVNLSPLLNP